MSGLREPLPASGVFLSPQIPNDSGRGVGRVPVGEILPGAQEGVDAPLPKEAEKRREHIVAILKEDSKTRPSALATTLGISSQNVQQDLRKLREAGRNPQDG